jgi:hypothetical protein
MGYKQMTSLIKHFCITRSGALLLLEQEVAESTHHKVIT